MKYDLLLHVCCGPCAIMPGKILLGEGLRALGYFYNPNIQPLGEYFLRREGAEKCAGLLGMDCLFDDAWDLAAWLEKQLPHAGTAARCENCIAMRLEAAARRARDLGVGKFSSTLLYSRYQPHDFIHQKGCEIGAAFGVEFLYRDFRPFWQAGIDASHEWELYRQKYCGCVFSEAERHAKKLKSLRQKMIDIIQPQR